MVFPNSNGDFMWCSYQLRAFTRAMLPLDSSCCLPVLQHGYRRLHWPLLQRCNLQRSSNKVPPEAAFDENLLKTRWTFGDDAFWCVFCVLSQCFQLALLAPSFFWGCRPGCHNLWISNDFKICQVKYHHVHRLFFYCCWANTAFSNKIR